MELRELKYFLAVAQTGSISAAADSLYITQPSLSRQMKNLEAEAGGELFERGSRRITLTERGKLLKKRAEEMLELYDKTMAEMSAPEHKICGEVRIGGGETSCAKEVIRAAAAVRRAHPEVKFRFFSGDSTAVSEKLDKGLIDFGVMLGVSDLSAYRSVRLNASDRWGVLVRRDDELAERATVTPEDLKGKPIITSDQSYARGMLEKWFNLPAEEIEVAATYNLLYVASQLAEEGAGYVLGLEGIINTQGGALKFIPLAPEIKNSIDVVWKKFAVFSPPAKAFLAELKRQCESG